MIEKLLLNYKISFKLKKKKKKKKKKNFIKKNDKN